MARRPFSKPIHAKEEGNCPPSADKLQGLSTAKPMQEAAMLPGPSVETHPPPPPPVLPFLLAVTSKQAVVAQVRIKVIACPCYPYI